MKKDRLDILVFNAGLADSRSHAQRLIMAGQVLVDGELNDSPADKISLTAVLTLKEKSRFVSRGGEKLEKALISFGFEDLRGFTCVDVGASTGGFTDCLLQHGAEKVFAIDVGYGQLHWSLRNHPRVVNIERTNARFLESLPEPVQLIVIDASFISLKAFWQVFPAWLEYESGDVLALIKPQFEAGKKQAAKGEGVIRDPQVQQSILEDLLTSAEEKNYMILGLTESPIKGPKGNREFLVHLRYPLTTKANIHEMVAGLPLFQEFQTQPPNTPASD